MVRAGGGVPMPVNVIFCDVPPNVTLIASTADFVPADTGEKLTSMKHVAPAASELPQRMVCEKSSASAPVTAIVPKVTAEVPIFLKVIWVPTPFPTRTLPKFKVVVLTMRLGAAVAVPASDTFWGEPVAESVRVSVADLEPADTGVKNTEILQVPPAAIDVPQLFVCAKSSAWPPVTAIDETVTAAEPPFVSAILWADEFVPATWLVKVKLV